jgi:hypothetical protein
LATGIFCGHQRSSLNTGKLFGLRNFLWSPEKFSEHRKLFGLRNFLWSAGKFSEHRKLSGHREVCGQGEVLWPLMGHPV